MQHRQKPKPEQIEKYSDHYISSLNPHSSYESNQDELIFTEDDQENCKYLIKSLNTLALDPQTQSTKKSFFYLKKAQKLSKSVVKVLKSQSPYTEFLKTVSELLSLTLNNLACYFKSCEKLVAAHTYLQKAIKIEKSLKLDPYEIATTLLNLTAVLSKMNNHEKALEHAQEAINILEKVDEERPIPEALTTAYYNYAVELEFIGKTMESKVYYERAYEVSEQKLGENNPRTQNFLNKLIEFNFTHSHIHDSSLSLKSTANKSLSQNTTQTNNKDPLNLLLTTYKHFGSMRFKVFFINKPTKALIKILAFPLTKFPVYRLMVNYTEISRLNSEPKGINEMSNEEIQSSMEKLLALLKITKGSLSFPEAKQRPSSTLSKTQKTLNSLDKSL